MNSKLSDKDKKDWEEFLSRDQKLPNKDNSKKKLKRGKVTSIDLHGYTLEEANQTVENFINKSFENNISKLIIVTGKGLHSDNENDPYVSKDLSILKYSVPEFIQSDKELYNLIISLNKADIKDGGDGALLIKLKNLGVFNET